MPQPYRREFREDVVRVARDRARAVLVEQVARDSGVYLMALYGAAGETPPRSRAPAC